MAERRRGQIPQNLRESTAHQQERSLLGRLRRRRQQPQAEQAPPQRRTLRRRSRMMQVVLGLGAIYGLIQLGGRLTTQNHSTEIRSAEHDSMTKQWASVLISPDIDYANKQLSSMTQRYFDECIQECALTRDQAVRRQILKDTVAGLAGTATERQAVVEDIVAASHATLNAQYERGALEIDPAPQRIIKQQNELVSAATMFRNVEPKDVGVESGEFVDQDALISYLGRRGIDRQQLDILANVLSAKIKRQ